MDTDPKREHITGLFADRTAAARALEQLVDAHFDIESDARVWVKADATQTSVPILSLIPDVRGGLAGIGVGVVLATVAFAIGRWDFGPFTMAPWGPLWAWFETAYVAGSVGMATGVMMSFEFAKPEAAFDRIGYRGGVVSVGVRAAGARAERARKILLEAGGTSPEERGPERVAA